MKYIYQPIYLSSNFSGSHSTSFHLCLQMFNAPLIYLFIYFLSFFYLLIYLLLFLFIRLAIFFSKSNPTSEFVDVTVSPIHAFSGYLVLYIYEKLNWWGIFWRSVVRSWAEAEDFRVVMEGKLAQVFSKRSFYKHLDISRQFIQPVWIKCEMTRLALRVMHFTVPQYFVKIYSIGKWLMVT